MKWNFVQKHLSSAFRALGFSIGRHPLPYLIVPLVVTAILSAGFFWIRVAKGLEYLFSPIGGRSLRERDAIESLFPPFNSSGSIMSITRLRELVAVIILPKDNSTVLREDVLEEAQKVDRLIRNITISWKDRNLTFRDVCLKSVSGDCNLNDVLNLRGRVQDIKRKKMRLKFPVDVDSLNQRVYIYAFGLGGVTVDDNNNILEASALRLFYLIDHSTEENRRISSKWEKSFLHVISTTELNNSRILKATGSSVDTEISRFTEMALPLLLIIAPIMVTFAVISSMTSNCVTSKPYVAIAATINPMLGCIAAFGLLLMLQIEYVDINVVILFLLVGVGLDDAFVLLAAWRRTDPKLKVEERMSQTYTEAAISITITSLTNCICLLIGLGSPFRFTHSYCTYAATSIIFAYIYQLTFFGSVMALSGIRERKSLHSFFFCFAIEGRKAIGSTTFDVDIGCTDKRQKRILNILHMVKASVDSFLNIIVTTGGKVTVMISFLFYLLSSSYCLTLINKQFDYRIAMPKHSYLVDYANAHFKYFTQYGLPIQIVINETLDYSEKKVQKNIEEMLCRFTEAPNMSRNDSYSWLKYYLQSTRDKKLWFAYYGYNISDSEDFISALRNVFLKFHNSQVFRENIRFNHNKTKIISSRFVLLSKDVYSSSQEEQLMTTLWSIADSTPYPIYVHNFWFPWFNTMTEITPTFISTLLTATCLVTAVFLIFIPSVLCIISILLTTISIQIGVIGFVSLWNVSINPVSIICLMVSIGLSVDYAAHISYAFLSSQEDNVDDKTKVALRNVGYPIIQGCLSTLLGVAIFVFAPSDAFLIFYKVITLLMLISLFHGLFVIPVMMNILDGIWRMLNIKMTKVVE